MMNERAGFRQNKNRPPDVDTPPATPSTDPPAYARQRVATAAAANDRDRGEAKYDTYSLVIGGGLHARRPARRVRRRHVHVRAARALLGDGRHLREAPLHEAREAVRFLLLRFLLEFVRQRGGL